MTRFVIDARTLVELIDRATPVDPSHRLVAPNGIRSAALDLLLAAVSSGELTEAEALRRHDRMTELKLRLLGDRVSRRTAWRIAREQGWASIRDAEYLAVTQLQADALVTVDPALAAVADGVVPLVPLNALLTPE